MGTARIVCFGHCMDTLRPGTAGILCDWTLQRRAAVRHCAGGEEPTDFLKSHNPTVMVGNNPQSLGYLESYKILWYPLQNAGALSP